jgi:hypothetical protein
MADDDTEGQGIRGNAVKTDDVMEGQGYIAGYVKP